MAHSGTIRKAEKIMTILSVSEKIASNLHNLGEDRAAAFDPATILVIAELVRVFIETFQNCRQTSREAHELMKKPTFRQKLAARLIIKRELGGRREFRINNGQRLLESMLKTGEELSAEEVESLYQEV